MALIQACPNCQQELELSDAGFANHVTQCKGTNIPKVVPRKQVTIEELEAKGLAPWKTGGDIAVYPGETTIYQRLLQFFNDYMRFDNPAYYDVVTAWVLHTWTIRNWRASGPLYLLGPVNSGKTTVLECLTEVAYRGVRGGSMSNSVMFRLSHAYTPTLLIDESQLYNREEWAETQAFLNERYRKGGRVWRMDGEGTNMVPKFFEAYGATALAGSSPPWEAMYNRSLILQMSKGQPRKQTLTPEFYKTGEELRALLKAYSINVDHLTTETELDQIIKEKLPEKYRTTEFLNQFPDPTEDAQAIRDYRVREIGIPLLHRAPVGGPRQNILSYLIDLEKKHDAVEKNSYLADYVIALDKCKKEGNKVTVKEVRLQLAVLWEVKTDSKDLPHPKTVMKALRTLGFDDTRVRSGVAIIWSEEVMTRLRSRFAFATSPTSLSVNDGVSNVANEGNLPGSRATEKDLCLACWNQKYQTLKGIGKVGPPKLGTCEDCGEPSGFHVRVGGGVQ